MASTNQTVHYDLSQYTANDKPTYLVDYNGDMNKIDTAIYSADSRSLVNESAIGDLTDLDTTVKSDLVSAVNELKGDVDTNTANIGTNTSNISTLGGNIGTMANLTTTDKTSLVNAVNEVNAVNQTQNTNISKNASDISTLAGFVDKLNIDNTLTLTGSNLVGENASIQGGTVTCKYDDSVSFGKIYGIVTFTPTYNIARIKIKGVNDILNAIESGFSISNLCLLKDRTSNVIVDVLSITLDKDNNQFDILCQNLTSGRNYALCILPMFLYFQDFGDPTPTPNV